MKSNFNVIIALILGWLAVCLQASVAPSIAIFGASPDFLLILLFAFCPTLSRIQCSLMGFLLAVGYAGTIGANLWQHVFSMTVSGFCLAWIHDDRITPTLPVMFGTAVFGTIFTKALLMFVAAPPGIGSYLGATILSALYNGVLLLPLYALLKRFLDSGFR